MSIFNSIFFTVSFLFVLLLTNPLFAKNFLQDYEEYCIQSGGSVALMSSQFATNGIVKGEEKKFCNFTIDGGFLSIGLETFASKKPSIAATLIQKLPPINEQSALWGSSKTQNQDKKLIGFANPSYKVCQNLGGSVINFISKNQSINKNNSGQSDICIFEDGSMVSGWTLIYMANNRSGYSKIKTKINSPPLEITIPQ